MGVFDQSPYAIKKEVSFVFGQPPHRIQKNALIRRCGHDIHARIFRFGCRLDASGGLERCQLAHESDRVLEPRRTPENSARKPRCWEARLNSDRRKGPIMYVARFSHDVMPANRQQALDFIRRELQSAYDSGLNGRILVPLTRGHGGSPAL